MLSAPSLLATAALVARGAARRGLTVMTSAAASLDWAGRLDNSLLRELRPEPPELPWWESRQVEHAHYTRVRPSVKPTEDASLVAYSTEVAEMLGLGDIDCEADDFLQLFSGKAPDDVECWATAYGASFAGRYGGQRGDGRAVSIGQLRNYEVQLKGAGDAV